MTEKFTKIVTPSKEEAVNLFNDFTPARRFKWVVEIEVDEIWVGDGFEITAEAVQEALLEKVPATHDEIVVKVLKRPDPVVIRQAQGYDDAQAAGGAW